MTNHKRYPICMEVAGHTAIWTRPDSGDCPCSYPAPTYSAVRGMFESVLWGPAVLVIPTKVELCAPIQYHSYATNYGGPLRSGTSVKGGNNYQLFATVLTDVCYRLYADVIPNPDKPALPPRALAWDSKTTSPGMHIRKSSTGGSGADNPTQRLRWAGQSSHRRILAPSRKRRASLKRCRISRSRPCCAAFFRQDIVRPSVRFLTQICASTTGC